MTGVKYNCILSTHIIASIQVLLLLISLLVLLIFVTVILPQVFWVYYLFCDYKYSKPISFKPGFGFGNIRLYVDMFCPKGIVYTGGIEI